MRARDHIIRSAFETSSSFSFHSFISLSLFPSRSHSKICHFPFSFSLSQLSSRAHSVLSIAFAPASPGSPLAPPTASSVAQFVCIVFSFPSLLFFFSLRRHIFSSFCIQHTVAPQLSLFLSFFLSFVASSKTHHHANATKQNFKSICLCSFLTHASKLAFEARTKAKRER